MEFRPCIDIHNGKVKQIVGGSLLDEGNRAKENFVAEQDAAFFAKLYREQGLKGGHIILLNPVGSEYYEATKAQAELALQAYPGGFQIGGGISGDFPICVVPMMYKDLEWEETPCWAYFCQISDSTTSYGSYSGAVPNEKITWGKLLPDTPSFIVESDATIVAPLIFAYVLGQ